MPDASINNFFADEMEGAEEIAAFVYPNSNRANAVRRVYRDFEHRRLPIYKRANKLHARKRTLVAHVLRQEEEAIAS